MCKTVVAVVTLLAAVASGYRTVIDIADFDTMRQLELENTVPIDKNDVNQPQELIMSKEKNPGDGDDGNFVPIHRSKLDKSIETHDGQKELDYLEPDWSAQGSIESEEEMLRVSRSVPTGDSRSSSEDDSKSSESKEDHEKDKGSVSDDSNPEEYSGERNEKNVTGASAGPVRSTEGPSIAPQLTVQGSVELERAEVGRARRTVNRRRWRFSSEDDSDDSPECYEDHEHGHHSHTWEDSGPEDSSEENIGTKGSRSGGVPDPNTTRPPVEFKDKSTQKDTPVVNTSPVPAVEGTTGTGRINIDPRFGVAGSEVRTKRMARNVAHSLYDRREDVKPVELNWMFDDQKKPEVAIRPRQDLLDDGYVRKMDFFRQQVPVVPCESKFERRDRTGRCISIFE